MKKIVKNIIAGLEDAIAYEQGDKSRGVSTTFTVPEINVKSIRKKTGLTQEAFSRLFAIKPRTLQDWEQDRRTPGVSARVFLLLIDQHPSAVKKTLRSLGQSLENKKKAKSMPTSSKKSHKKISEPNQLRNKRYKKT